jgi:hypothetical protein
VAFTPTRSLPQKITLSRSFQTKRPPDMHPKVLHSASNSRNAAAPQNPVVKPPQKDGQCVAPVPSPNQSQFKKVTRRSSKPIINWFQRKLAGTVKTTRRTNNGVPNVGNVRSSAASGRERVVSTPNPTLAAARAKASTNGIKMETLVPARRKTISLNERDDMAVGSVITSDGEGGYLSTRSSVALESIWSPASAVEADEDASLRPIPPSSPPSPSRSSSSYLSDPRTFRSMTASTKPTTLLSVDLTPIGMAHIAQAPSAPMTRFSTHTRTTSAGTTGALLSSAASITFSALPPPSPQSSRPSSTQHASLMNSSYLNTPQGIASVQAPLHTTHHPRNNPRPSSPPLDNASLLTLASSAFASPGGRIGSGIGWNSASPSALGDSTSQFESIAGDGSPDGDMESIMVDEERDIGASVRALRPRSSRRGSWDSEVSGWSARIGQGPGTPSLTRDRSLWTANSVRTGGQLSGDREPASDEELEDDKVILHPCPGVIFTF